MKPFFYLFNGLDFNDDMINKCYLYSIFGINGFEILLVEVLEFVANTNQISDMSTFKKLLIQSNIL